MRVLMSGGGTAGHVYPALTVAERLVAEHDDVAFVGTPNGLEARLVPEAGVAFSSVAASGFDRSRPWTLVAASIQIAVSAVRMWHRMGSVRPDVVVGFGGFVSIPVGLAAAWRGIPLVLHEQNSVPGLANRFLSRSASAVAATYEESTWLFSHPDRVSVTGNPVRDEVLASERDSSRRSLGLKDDSIMMLVFGGSRGARHLNTALTSLMGRLLELERLVVIHVAGRGEVDSVRVAAEADPRYDPDRWRILDYVDGMGEMIAAADLVVCRAGATSLAEITALGVAAVLVPYPYATDDHQTKNAATVVRGGAAVLVPDPELDTQRFGDELVELLSGQAQRATMSAASRALGRPEAAQHVADLVRRVAGTSRRTT